MPILGLNVPESLLETLRACLIREIAPNPVIKLYTKAESIAVRRKAYAGDYAVFGHNKGGFFPIAKFAMLPLPGCRGVCMFYHAAVEPEFRKHGLGRELLKAREYAAFMAGFSVAMATVRDDNYPESRMLLTANWLPISSFKNRRNGNMVTVWSKKL